MWSVDTDWILSKHTLEGVGTPTCTLSLQSALTFTVNVNRTSWQIHDFGCGVRVYNKPFLPRYFRLCDCLPIGKQHGQS
jgi:hypothetical protein